MTTNRESNMAASLVQLHCNGGAHEVGYGTATVHQRSTAATSLVVICVLHPWSFNSFRLGDEGVRCKAMEEEQVGCKATARRKASRET